MWSVVINALLGFVMAITLIFTLGDVDNLFASVTRQPFIQLFFNATQSYGGTNTMTAIVIILLAACCTSEVATASRQLWSFARDQGLPGSSWLAKVRQFSNTNASMIKLTDLCSLGHSWVERTSPSCPRLARRQFLAGMHQPGIVDCFECHQLSRWCIDPDILLYHHQLSHLPTSQRPSPSSSTMVARQVRSVDQHRRHHLPDSTVVLCLLASLDPGYAPEHELVVHHVRWCPHHCPSVLLLCGPTRLRRASCFCQTRRIESASVLLIDYLMHVRCPEFVNVGHNLAAKPGLVLGVGSKENLVYTDLHLCHLAIRKIYCMYIHSYGYE